MSNFTNNPDVAMLARLEKLARRIDALLIAKGEVLDANGCHVWNRPYFNVELFEGEDTEYYAMMYLSEDRTKSYGLNNQPSLGVNMGGLGEHVQLHFDNPPQDKLRTLAKWFSAFEAMEQALERAVNALENNGSMQPGFSNAQVLMGLLDNLHSSQIEEWQGWVQQWGTAQMQESLKVANSLLDARTSFSAWKGVIASGVNTTNDTMPPLGQYGDVFSSESFIASQG